MVKRKTGTGSKAPKAKQPRVTLPLYPDFDETESSTVPLIKTNRSSYSKSSGASKPYPKPTSPAAGEHSSEGDDDYDFGDTTRNNLDTAIEVDEDDTTSDPDQVEDRSRPRKRVTKPKKRRVPEFASVPDSSSESDSSDDDIQDLAAQHIGNLTGALPDYDANMYGKSVTTPVVAQVSPKIQQKNMGE